ncbi:MAG: saccharopine dehydrogenase [Promethearchaeota archaeon]|nr:MAG: saccharopine dehydrogenase [Candidatus Lokiarchaeota archaeon]
MSKVIVLGGCGVVGSVVVNILNKSPDFSEIIIADINIEKAKEMSSEMGEKVGFKKVDANDKLSIKNAIKEMDLVVNCIGPFYKYEKIILEAAIEEKKNYLDICDDTGATYDALELDDAAKKAEITALLGMGSSPGLTNVLAAYAANNLLEECESIDMYHIHGGEPNEGPAVIGHRFYCMSNPIPIYIDGEAKLIDPENSEEYEEDVEFVNLPGKYHVYPYPHPEPITIPQYIEGIKRVTNKGSVLPEKYYQLTRKLHAAGLDSKESINIRDINGDKCQIRPYDFAIAYLIKEREKLLKEENIVEARGSVKVVIKGKKKRTREERTYIFSLISEGAAKGQGLGEGTGIPAAFGAILLQRKKIEKKGVVPPEACVNALDILQLMQELYQYDEKDEKSRSPLIFQSIDKQGNKKTLKFTDLI